MELKQFVELIDKYLSGDLTKEEHDQFLEALDQYPEFREELNIRSAVRESITAQLDIEEVKQDPDLKTILNDLEQQDQIQDQEPDAELLAFISRSSMSSSGKSRGQDTQVSGNTEKANSSKTSRSRKVYLWSATIAASLAALTLISIALQSSTTDNLYENYYHKFEPINYSFRNSNQNEINFKEGLEAYNEGNIINAISYFENISGESRFQEERLFFLSLSYLENGKYQTASKLLEQYLEKYSKYKIETHWYLSLAFIKLNEIEEAEHHLAVLTSEPSSFQKRAESLLSSLARIK